jgi:hypothetical protein
MSIKPLTPAKQKAIAKNVIAACKDITKLSKTGYDFINLASGFIAHYDLHGFIDYYTSNSLRSDIMENRSRNMWSNFREGEQNYEYYMSQRDTYLMIVEAIA